MMWRSRNDEKIGVGETNDSEHATGYDFVVSRTTAKTSVAAASDTAAGASAGAAASMSIPCRPVGDAVKKKKL